MAYRKVFVDSDIILDLLLQREPFTSYSQVLFAGNIPEIKLYTSSLILANVHYLIQKHTNKTIARNRIKEVIGLIDILSLEAKHVTLALNLEHIDFEDSIQFYIASEHNCDLIITRNIRHYKTFDIPVLTAEQFLRSIL